MRTPCPSSFVRVAVALLAALLAATCRDDRLPTAPAEPTLQTTTAPGTAAILVGAGEVERCDNAVGEATARLLDTISGTVFTTGDNIRYSGALTEFTACYDPTWGRHKARTRPAAGGYEYQTAGAAGYFDYFGSAAGERDKGYYSYDLGAWHIVVLNSNIAAAVGSAQEQWLRADLAASAKRCTLAYWQHPLFSSSATAVRAAVKPLWDDLYAAGAEVVVNGHDRVYERFAPQSPEEVADAEHGLRQFTVGTGGHGVGVFGMAVRPNSEVRLSGVYGVLKLTLGDETYAWQFVPIAGQTAGESGTGTCHGVPGAPQANQPPIAGFTPLCNGLSCTFTDRSRDPDGRVVAWRWDFGDGWTSTSQNPLHTYAAAGLYNVHVTATDDRGATSTSGEALPLPIIDLSVTCTALLCTFTESGPVVHADYNRGRVLDLGDGSGCHAGGFGCRYFEHWYSRPGTYTVKLTDALAGWDQTASVSKSVTVGNGLAVMPTARTALAAATVNGVIYAIGGASGEYAALRTVEAYDPVTNTWTAKAPMPTPRSGLAAAVVNGVIYAIGGDGNGTVEAYDPVTDTWTAKARLPTPLGGATAAAIKGVIYAIGGDGTLEAYDPAIDTWTKRASRPNGAADVAAVNGILYAVGPQQGLDFEGFSPLDAYDPATDTWTAKAPMPLPADLGLTSVNGLLYVFGGYAPYRDMTGQAYDPSTDGWSGKAAIPVGRANFAVVAAQGAIYAIGGKHRWSPGYGPWQEAVDADIERYDPVTDTWR